MAIAYNSSIVTSGLTLNVDAGSPRSYPGSGTLWYDASGNNNTGTLVNGPTYTGGTSGYFTFDGVDDLTSFTNTNGFGTGGVAPQATMSIWANISRKSGGGQQFQQIAGFRDDTDYNFFFLLLDSSGATVATEARLGTTAGLAYDINVDFTPYFNTWTNIVFVANTNRSDLYFNGILAGSNTNVAGNFGADSGQFCIGRHPAVAAFPTLGKIANVQFYKRALTATEITQNFNALRGRYGV